MKVGVVGSSAVDIFAVSKFFRPQLGDQRSHIVLEHGSQLWLDNAINEPGGDGLIASLVFARQANTTQLLTRIANDLYGDIIKTIAAEEHVQLMGNIHTTQTHTDTTLHLRSASQDQTILHFTGSYLRLNKADLANLRPDIDLLHIASLPTEKSLLNKLLAFAKRNTIEVSINPRFIHTLPSKALLKILRACNIVVINQDEASLLLGTYCSCIEAAEKLSRAGIGHIVVYCNDAQSVVVKDSVAYIAQEPPKNKSIDGSGAEAVFAAGYVEQFVKSANVGLALSHGLRQAASVKTIIGTRSGILKQPVFDTLKITTKTL